MSESEVWTVGRLLEWTTDYLKEHQADSPRLDAEVLLAEALGCGRIDLYTAFGTQPGEKARAAFREFVRRRAQGTPVAYLVGRREFYSLQFDVTPDVLIPRPETELAVITLLDLAKARPVDEPVTIADVGTGSGIIAVSVAKHLPNARVTAVDRSAAALDVARGNVAKHELVERIELIESDLLAAVDLGCRFDFIVSNPPYVKESEWETLAPDVRDHEPRTALVAGQHGTDVIEPLIAQAAERLNPGGHLLIEISPTIHDAVMSLMNAENRFVVGDTIKDLARLPRVVQGRRRG